MRTYKHPMGTRRAYERRYGHIDDHNWERLAKQFELHEGIVYDDADLKDFAQLASKLGLPKSHTTRRRGSWATDFYATRPLALDEDIELAQGRLSLGMELGQGWKLHPVAVVALMLMAYQAFVSADDDDRPRILGGLFHLRHWWEDFVGEVARLARMHRIADWKAFEHLAGYSWVTILSGRQRLRVKMLSILDAMPDNFFSMALKTNIRATTESRAKLRRRPELLRIFLEVIDWQSEDGPPLGDWDSGRRMFNRVMKDMGDKIAYDGTQTQAFRQAVRRARLRIVR